MLQARIKAAVALGCAFALGAFAFSRPAHAADPVVVCSANAPATPANCATVTGGGINVNATFSASQIGILGQYNSTLPTYTSGSASTIQTSVNGVLYAQIYNGGSTPAIGTSISDAVPVGTVGMWVHAVGELYNGSSLDRTYSANAANGTTGTGVAAAGNMVYNGTNWYSLAGDSTGSVSVFGEDHTSTQAGGTLGAVGTFSSVLASASNRRGCTIQNTSNDTEYVFFGATGSATTANSLQLFAGDTLNCNSGNIVASDNIAMAGKANASDTYVVINQ